jgi:spermidine synthase
MADSSTLKRPISVFGRRYNNSTLLLHDVTLLGIMMVLAGCGMIYEFLLSHYAARVLGATEVAIFGVFTIMIASMGVGSFAAKKLRCAFTSFAWLELAIALIGATAVLLIAAAITFTHLLPIVIGETYGLTGIEPSGGIVSVLQTLGRKTPYIMAFVLGALIGAEIPLIARVRESVYGMHLEHNTGTVYGADYIGAGIGATLFVIVLLTLNVTVIAVVAASANLLAGLLFYACYRGHIRFKHLLFAGHISVAILVGVVAVYGGRWEKNLEDMLYKDKVVHSMNTRYQRVVVTKRIMDPRKAPVHDLHINGHTQFSSHDEKIYHSMLTYPAMAASARHDNVLIIGGGDGLALRDVLRWDPEKVVLIDLDKQIIDFFTKPYVKDGEEINYPLLKLNDWAFSDPRVEVRIGDAFIYVDGVLQEQHRFDTIIVDLPDPNHPDLNKLYSARFYAKLLHLLSGDGALSIQSTSPYHAKEAFISIGKTVKFAGFQNVEQYHTNVPSFGEWGWTIATPTGQSAKQRLSALEQLPRDDGWMTKDLLVGAFAFSKGFYEKADAIKINRLGSNVIYDYHRLGWAREVGNL